MKRCPRDGRPIRLVRQKCPVTQIRWVHCMRGGACGVMSCPLSWPANCPPSAVVREMRRAAEAARVRTGKGVDHRAKRRAKMARRKQYAEARKAKREARPPAVRPQPQQRRLADDPLALMASLVFISRQAAARGRA